MCGNKLPTRCNRGFYCRSYCLLNMFRAPLCPSSGAQEYYTDTNLRSLFSLHSVSNKEKYCVIRRSKTRHTMVYFQERSRFGITVTEAVAANCYLSRGGNLSLTLFSWSLFSKLFVHGRKLNMIFIS